MLLANATEVEFRQILSVSSSGQAESNEKVFHVSGFKCLKPTPQRLQT